ncbi:MAG: phage holin family protein [Balneolaceae bacterium]|nr:phage holin family protein [Balneolaceae bacterium]
MENDTRKDNDALNLTSEVRLYIEKRIELLTLTIAEQVSLIAAQTIQQIIGLLLLGGAAFFFWFALSFLLGQWIGNIGLGFLIMSVPLFIGAFIFSSRKSKKVTDSIQADILKKTLQGVNKEFRRELTEGKKSEENSEE